MNIEKHLDNGFLLLKEDDKISSPLGCMFFSYYKDHNDVIEYIDQNKEKIQVVMGNPDFIHATKVKVLFNFFHIHSVFFPAF